MRWTKTLDLLRGVYVAQLTGERSHSSSVSRRLGVTAGELKEALRESVALGLVRKGRGSLELTERGRRRLKVVMIGGAFEIIHPGHVHTITEARKLGNLLVVVVATDETVSRNKKREPITSQEWRVRLASQLRLVDVAIPGGSGNIYDTLERVRPDVVALGYDQFHNPEEIIREAGRRGVKVSVARLGSPLPGVKTSKIAEAYI